MLLTKDIEALVIHIDLKEKQLLEKMKIMFGSKKQVKTGTNLFFGLSTRIWRWTGMSLIPGNVGTTPKISGHGTEIKDTFVL
jgi:UDP-N-acetylmuramate dehydrogenase